VKLGLFTKTKNIRFVSSRQRVQRKIETLKERLALIRLDGRFDNVILTFVDESLNYFRVIQKGPNDDVYQVNVGYEFSADYPPEDDVLVIQLLEEKLARVINSHDGFAAKREELLRVITDWTTEAIGA